MADLSQTKVRLTQQDRVTDRRSGVIPGRRNVEAPDFRGAATLSSASRGDGGADEIRRVFGMATNAASSIQDYANASYRKSEQDAGAQGAIDQAAGVVNDDQMKRSAAYRTAVTVGEADKRWFETADKIDADIDKALNDPTHPADEDDINDIINGHYKALGLDGNAAKDFGSPEANKRIAQRMMEARPGLLAQARDKIKRQVEERSINTTTANLSAVLQRGGALDFEGAFKTITPGTDMVRAKGALIESVTNYAASVQATDPARAMSMLDGLLASKRADGTPSLNPQERAGLLSEKRQMQGEITRAEAAQQRATQTANQGKFMDRLMRVPGSGGYPSAVEIAKAREANLIDPQDAHMLMNWIESDEREARSEARSARAEARADAAERRAAMHDAAEATGNSTVSAVLSGSVGLNEARRKVLADAAGGLYGSGDARRKGVSQALSQLNAIEGARQDGVLTGPKFKQGAENLRQARSLMTSNILSMKLPPARRKAANAWVSKVMDAAVAKYSSAAIEKGDPGDLDEAIIKSVHRNFLSTFHGKTTTK